MRPPDVEIFPVATCFCKLLWTRWCRGCCLVFCDAHIQAHPCRGRTLGVGGSAPQGPERGRRPKRTMRKKKMEVKR